MPFMTIGCRGVIAEYADSATEQDPMTAWSQNCDWTAILQNAKETYLAMPKAYEHGLKCQNIIDSLESWSGARLLKRAHSRDVGLCL